MFYQKHQNIIINISIIKTRLQSSIKQKGITLNLSKCPRLNKFFYSILFSFIGSPAEKADLEVADEILEINGQSLENSSHTDIIAHIHNVS